MKKIYFIWALMLSLQFITSEKIFSQPQLIWERFNIVPNGSSAPVDLEVDSTGNIYKLCSEGGFVVLKYDKYGTLKWRVSYDHPNLRLGTSPKSMAIDKEGNVYCVGDNNYEIVTIKIDNNGRLDWIRAFSPGAGFYTVGGIAIDPSGNVVVAGGSPSNFQRIIYGVIKYKPDGDTVWVKVKTDVSPYTGGNPKNLVVSKSGNIYFSGEINVDSAGIYQSRVYSVKLNSNGDLIWLNKYYLRKSGYRYTLLDKSEENVYFVGGVAEDLIEDIIIQKFDVNGNNIWSRRYDTDEGYYDELRGAELDKENNVIFTAKSGVLTPTFILTVKYDTNGNLVWERRFIANSSIENEPSDLIIDNENNSYIVGKSNFINTKIYITTLKYSSEGNLLWYILNGTPLRYNIGRKLIKFSDFVYVTGQMLWTSGQINSILIKYSENPLNIKNNIEVLNYELHQNYPNPFNPKTKISYSIKYQSLVTINVYDLTGKKIQTLVNENKNAGDFEVKFSSSNIPSGIYFYTLFINNEKIQTRKMVLVK